MNKNIRIAAAAGLALLLCGIFLTVLLWFIRPMADASFDLSLGWGDSEGMPDGWVYDQKGWELFTQQGDVRTPLEADGYGGFTGCPPGETFYYGRVLTEEMDNPTLHIGGAYRHNSLSVFLDGALLYTDCPQEDNRIGYLRLPMEETTREAAAVTLPRDYLGKTLVIAESTYTEPEIPGKAFTVYLSPVTLFCGYSYESGLIASSFQTAVPSSLLFAAGVVLLVMFVWQATARFPDLNLLFASLAAFLWMANRMQMSGFYSRYYGDALAGGLPMRKLSLVSLLLFLSMRLSGWRRLVGLGVTGAALAVTLTETGLLACGHLTLDFVQYSPLAGLLGLGALLALTASEWNRKKLFGRLLVVLTGAGMVIFGAVAAICALAGHSLLEFAGAGYFERILQIIVMAAGMAAATTEFLRAELSRKLETKLLLQRSELTQKNYEAMHRQHEEILMLRHDLTKHITLLRGMTHEEAVADYLDGLIGEQKKIRPVVQSGNEILDIILNGKLADAVDAGIEVSITNAKAPAVLPMPEKDLCALMMNIMDNALKAARQLSGGTQYIQIDLHTSGNFLVFTCENSAGEDPKAIEGQGLGLKIMRQTAERCDCLLETKPGPGHYMVTVAIPLT